MLSHFGHPPTVSEREREAFILSCREEIKNMLPIPMPELSCYYSPSGVDGGDANTSFPSFREEQNARLLIFPFSISLNRLREIVRHKYTSSYQKVLDSDPIALGSWKTFAMSSLSLCCFQYTEEDMSQYPSLSSFLTTTDTRCYPMGFTFSQVKEADGQVGKWLWEKYLSLEYLVPVCVRVLGNWPQYRYAVQEHLSSVLLPATTTPTNDDDDDKENRETTLKGVPPTPPHQDERHDQKQHQEGMVGLMRKEAQEENESSSPHHYQPPPFPSRSSSSSSSVAPSSLLWLLAEIEKDSRPSLAPTGSPSFATASLSSSPPPSPPTSNSNTSVAKLSLNFPFPQEPEKVQLFHWRKECHAWLLAASPIFRVLSHGQLQAILHSVLVWILQHHLSDHYSQMTKSTITTPPPSPPPSSPMQNLPAPVISPEGLREVKRERTGKKSSGVIQQQVPTAHEEEEQQQQEEEKANGKSKKGRKKKSKKNKNTTSPAVEPFSSLASSSPTKMGILSPSLGIEKKKSENPGKASEAPSPTRPGTLIPRRRANRQPAVYDDRIGCWLIGGHGYTSSSLVKVLQDYHCVDYKFLTPRELLHLHSWWKEGRKFWEGVGSATESR